MRKKSHWKSILTLIQTQLTNRIVLPVVKYVARSTEERALNLVLKNLQQNPNNNY